MSQLARCLGIFSVNASSARRQCVLCVFRRRCAGEECGPGQHASRNGGVIAVLCSMLRNSARRTRSHFDKLCMLPKSFRCALLLILLRVLRTTVTMLVSAVSATSCCANVRVRRHALVASYRPRCSRAARPSMTDTRCPPATLDSA